MSRQEVKLPVCLPTGRQGGASSLKHGDPWNEVVFAEMDEYASFTNTKNYSHKNRNGIKQNKGEEQHMDWNALSSSVRAFHKNTSVFSVPSNPDKTVLN
jgi:hypothetical protein